jgi:hypothetical protein
VRCRCSAFVLGRKHLQDLRSPRSMEEVSCSSERLKGMHASYFQRRSEAREGVLSGGLSKLYRDGSLGISSVASCFPAREQRSGLWKPFHPTIRQATFPYEREDGDHPTSRIMPTRNSTVQQYPSGDSQLPWDHRSVTRETHSKIGSYAEWPTTCIKASRDAA